MIRTSTLRRSLGWLMIAILALSILIWLLTRDTLPRTIRIATAERGGLYYSLGQGKGGLATLELPWEAAEGQTVLLPAIPRLRQRVPVGIRATA